MNIIMICVTHIQLKKEQILYYLIEKMNSLITIIPYVKIIVSIMVMI